MGCKVDEEEDSLAPEASIYDFGSHTTAHTSATVHMERRLAFKPHDLGFAYLDDRPYERYCSYERPSISLEVKIIRGRASYEQS